MATQLFVPLLRSELPALVPPEPGCKKGLAYTFSKQRRGDASALGCAWYYDWSGRDPQADEAEWAPMCWGPQQDWWPPDESSKSAYVLGFNEPDMLDQANLSPSAAVPLWREMELRYPHKRLVSPAPILDEHWLERFREAYRDTYGGWPRLDCIAIHTYLSLIDAQRVVLRYLEKALAWGIPGGLWVTEFAQRAVADLRTYCRWLDAQPDVWRYAAFTNRDDGRQSWSGRWPALLDWGSGSPSELGRAYRDVR